MMIIDDHHDHLQNCHEFSLFMTFLSFPRNFSQPMKLLRNGSLDEVHAVHINPSHEGAITRQRPPGKYAKNVLFMWIYTIQMIPKCIWSDVTAISVYPFMIIYAYVWWFDHFTMNIQRLSRPKSEDMSRCIRTILDHAVASPDSGNPIWKNKATMTKCDI